MKPTFFTLALASILLFSCNSEPSLQKYFVENSEKKDFVALDVSPSIINVDKSKLTAEQKTALASFDKMNILAFKLDNKNKAQFEAESQKLKQILKGEDYQELMHVGSGKDAASVSYVGEEDDICQKKGKRFCRHQDFGQRYESEQYHKHAFHFKVC